MRMQTILRLCAASILTAVTAMAAQTERQATDPTDRRPMTQGGVSTAAATDHRGTAEQPLIVSQGLPTEAARFYEAPERAARANADRRAMMIGLTTITVLVVQTFVFGWQAYQLRESVKEMKHATEATQEVAKAERDTVATMRRQLRSYVFVEDHTIVPTSVGAVATVTVRNFGLTPAYRLRIDAHAQILATNSQPPSAVPSESVVGTLAPQGAYTLQISVEGFNPLHGTPQIVAGQLKAFVWGRADFEDAFGNTERWMTFRLVTPTGPHWQALASCDGGNDSDRS